MTRPLAVAGPLALVIALALLDQIVKQVMESMLDERTVVPVLGPVNWFLTHNTGIAFSWLSGLGANGLAILGLVILVVVIVLWTRTPRSHRFAWFGFALIAGGAIGNLIDRVLLGHVVDYVLLTYDRWSFAVFNLADAFITVGASLILADELLGWGRSEPTRDNVPQ